MEPTSGKIFAIAQYPFFHTPLYPSYFSSEEKMDETRVKGIQDAQEPGSVMKPFTLAVGLLANYELQKEGKPLCLTLKQKWQHPMDTFQWRKKLLEDTHLHYFLNMWMALQKIF